MQRLRLSKVRNDQGADRAERSPQFAVSQRPLWLLAAGGFVVAAVASLFWAHFTITAMWFLRKRAGERNHTPPVGAPSQLLDGRGVKLGEGPCTGPPRYDFDGQFVPTCGTQVE